MNFVPCPQPAPTPRPAISVGRLPGFAVLGLDRMALGLDENIAHAALSQPCEVQCSHPTPCPRTGTDCDPSAARPRSDICTPQDGFCLAVAVDAPAKKRHEHETAHSEIGQSDHLPDLWDWHSHTDELAALETAPMIDLAHFPPRIAARIARGEDIAHTPGSITPNAGSAWYVNSQGDQTRIYRVDRWTGCDCPDATMRTNLLVGPEGPRPGCKHQIAVWIACFGWTPRPMPYPHQRRPEELR